MATYDDNGVVIDAASVPPDFGTAPIDSGSGWTPAVIASFVHDGEGIASAWYTASTGKAVVTADTPPGLSQAQLNAYAGGALAQSQPGVVFAATQPGALVAGNTGLILIAIAAVVLVLVLKA